MNTNEGKEKKRQTETSGVSDTGKVFWNLLKKIIYFWLTKYKIVVWLQKINIQNTHLYLASIQCELEVFANFLSLECNRQENIQGLQVRPASVETSNPSTALLHQKLRLHYFPIDFQWRGINPRLVNFRKAYLPLICMKLIHFDII